MLLIHLLYVPSKGLTILPKKTKQKQTKGGGFFLPQHYIQVKKRVPLRAHISAVYIKGSSSNRAHIPKKGLGRSHNQRKTNFIKTVDGYSVFGNPALPVPENPKAEQPI